MMYRPAYFAGRSFYMDSIDYDSFADLFPMPMTSIEKFHFWDCDSEHPNVNHCRMRFAIKLDPAIAKRAWQLAMERQPFADVEPRKLNGRWVWNAGPRSQGESSRAIENWNGTGFKFRNLDAPPIARDRVEHRIRSVTGSFLDIVVWPEDATDARNAKPSTMPDNGKQWFSEVYFFVHHAIADGAAASMVINDWVMIYANLRSGRPPVDGIHRLDRSLLRRRGKLGLLEWRYLKHVPKQVIALFGAAKFAFRKTVQLVPSQNQVDVSQDGREFPAIIGRWISESQYKRLNSVAHQHGVMLNSVLLGQLYVALARWRIKLGVHAERDWIRIILPMSIRNVSDRRLPAANRATIVQIDRRGNDVKDADALYHGLNREIRIIRGWHLEKIFLVAIGCLSGFESFLKRAAGSERSRGTAVFTNLGEPFRRSERSLARRSKPEAELKPIEFDPAGPIRKGTAANFTASRYDKRLRVSLHYDTAVLSPKQAASLLDQYVGQLNAIE